MNLSTALGSALVRWGLLIVIFLALMTLAVVDSGGPPTSEERVQELSANYACPICDGQSVAESNASVARTIREFIALEVATGSSDEAIRNQLIASYGGEVLLTPRSDGFFSLLWVLPVAVLVFGSAAVWAAAMRAQTGSADPTDEDIAMVEAARAAQQRVNGGPDR